MLFARRPLSILALAALVLAALTRPEVLYS
jgi:hypothetical protein